MLGNHPGPSLVRVGGRDAGLLLLVVVQCTPISRVAMRGRRRAVEACGGRAN